MFTSFVFFFFSLPPVSLPLPYITIASFSFFYGWFRTVRFQRPLTKKKKKKKTDFEYPNTAEGATNPRLASVSIVEWVIFARTKRKERRLGFVSLIHDLFALLGPALLPAMSLVPALLLLFSVCDVFWHILLLTVFILPTFPKSLSLSL